MTGVAMESSYTAQEQRLIELWERHLRFEFSERDAAATVATMSDYRNFGAFAVFKVHGSVQAALKAS